VSQDLPGPAGDPVSWLQIAPGWSVVGSDGVPVGSVLTVTGDKSDDIFDGLAVGGGPGQARYVPAEQVEAIRPGQVTLKIGSAGFAALGAFTEPPPEQELKLPPRTLGRRLSDWLRGGR
jgi:hypothetical protein